MRPVIATARQLFRRAASAKAIQPTISAVPPKGVIALPANEGLFRKLKGYLEG